jgi:AcrR family transcriptional regulator
LSEYSVSAALSQRTAILEAAVRVIGRDGIGGIKSAAIAREAGVSPGLVHYYFETLEVLTREAFLYADQVSVRERPNLVTEPGNGRAELEARLCAWLDDGDAYEQAWAVWGELWHASRHDEAVRRQLEQMWNGWVGLIERLLERGMRDGSVPAGVQPTPVARRLAALMESLGQQMSVELLPAPDARRLMQGALALELQAGVKNA